MNRNRHFNKRATKKISAAIDAKLHSEFVAVAKASRQSQRSLLEKAIAHFIQNVIPSERAVRPEVMEAFHRSDAKFRGLYRKLAE